MIDDQLDALEIFVINNCNINFIWWSSNDEIYSDHIIDHKLPINPNNDEIEWYLWIYLFYSTFNWYILSKSMGIIWYGDKNNEYSLKCLQFEKTNDFGDGIYAFLFDEYWKI